MKVLFLSNYYPPHEVGGYEQLCRDVAIRLVQQGHMAQVLTSTWGAEGSADGAIPIHRLLHLSPAYDSHLPLAAQFFLTRRYAERHNRKALRRVATRFQPDLVFIWNVSGLPRPIAVDAESIPGVAVAYWLAGYSPAASDEYEEYWMGHYRQRRSGWAPTLLASLAMRVLRAEGKPIRPRMAHVAVVSEFERRRGVDGGHLPAHTRVLYNGVEVDAFRAPVRTEVSGPLRLLYAGRLSVGKSVHTIIESLRALACHSRASDVHLTVVGQGPRAYLDYLEQRVAESGLEKRVTFSPWIPRVEMPEVMRSHDVLVLPTEHAEPFARVVLEAMAAGLTVVSTSTGGTSEIVRHGETGLMFAAGDPEDLARKLLRLIREPELRESLARAGQARVMADYSMDRMVDEIEEFLVEAVGGLDFAPGPVHD